MGESNLKENWVWKWTNQMKMNNSNENNQEESRRELNKKNIYKSNNEYRFKRKYGWK